MELNCNQSRLSSNPYTHQAVDSSGIPTTYLSYLILRKLFREPHCWFTRSELSDFLVFPRVDVDTVCNGLVAVGLILEEDTKTRGVCYNLLSCANIDLQAGFERFLVDVAYDSIPVESILDYSPSRPYPATCPKPADR